MGKNQNYSVFALLCSIFDFSADSIIVRHITLAGLSGQEMNIEFVQGKSLVCNKNAEVGDELWVFNLVLEYDFLFIIGPSPIGDSAREAKQVFTQYPERL